MAYPISCDQKTCPPGHENNCVPDVTPQEFWGACEGCPVYRLEKYTWDSMQESVRRYWARQDYQDLQENEGKSIEAY